MSEGWSGAVRGVGPAVLVITIGAVLAAATTSTALRATTVASALEAASIGILTIAIMARGLTLHASDNESGEKWRIAGWCLVGTLAASVLAGLVLVRAALHGNSLAQPFVLVEIFAGAGAIAGLFVGGDQVRAIRAGRSSERKHTSELLAKREEERLTFLNNLLRHNVLNGMNIVIGYTAALDDKLDSGNEYVERIRSRSESVVELVQNVQVLVRSLSGDLEVDAVDLSETAELQVERARANHNATYHANLDPDVTVATTPFISSAIENLLTNAAVHNPDPDPVVHVAVEQRGEFGVISIADNGPGIPDDVVETYFGDNHPDEHFVGDGLGLYLVDELVTTHGGDIEIESGDDGTTICLEFPLTADTVPATEGQSSPATAD